MRFYGTVGFVDTVKTAPGVFSQKVVAEKQYFGDVLNWNPRTEVSNSKANDDLNVSNRISILADSYANSHLQLIKYIIWNDVKWRVKDVTVSYPRLTLDIGGVYNGEGADDDDSSEYED